MRISRVEQLEVRTMLSVDFVNSADSLDQQLVQMQDRLTTALSFFQTGATSHIPIVGDQLGRAADIVDSFRDELREAIESLGASVPTDLQLQTSLAGRLAPFLGNSGAAGVHVSRAGDVATVEMILQGTAVVDGIDIGFDTGLPSLPIKFTTDGELEISVGYALELAFTINVSTGSVALVDGSRNLTGVTAPDASHPLLNNNSDLALFVTAGPSADFNAKAVFGFVEGNASPIPGAANGLYATALVSNLLSAPTIKLDGSADANLRLAGSFAGTGDDFPGISTDFHLHWSLSSGSNFISAPPTVAFDNVSLTFGAFLSNVLRPSLQPIKDALEPIRPILELLGTEIPGISDLSEAAGAGPTTVLDLATLASQVTGNGPLGELADKIATLLQKIDSIQLGPNISLPLGGFDLNGGANGDLRAAVVAGDFKDLDLANLTQLAATNLNSVAQSAAQSYKDIVNGLGLDADLTNELLALTPQLATPNGFEIKFPFLDNPAGTVFNMLLGRDSDLFYFQADADVQLKGSQATGLSFFSQPVILAGQAHIQTHLKFAYDTFGLRQLITNLAAGDPSHIVSDITDGFYISADSYFNMSGSITADWGSSIANVIPLSISGGLFTQEHGTVPVRIYIEDPNGDGKLRFSEFHLGDDGQPAAFRTTGQLLAGLTLEVGFPDPDGDGPFPTPPNESMDIAIAPIFTFTTPTPLRLASQPDANGKITLYLGTNAHLRANGTTDGGDEKFVIEHLGTNPNGSENIRIRAFGTIQDINNVRSIVATDQVGKLEFIALPGVTSSVDITGGQGAAELSYFGTGTAKLTGGALASTLKGGSGPSILTGGPGDDTIILGSGTNTVDAKGGDNTVIVTTPVYQNSTISGGTTGHNNLQVFASTTTTAISATPVGSTIDLGVQNGISQAFVHLIFSNFDDVYFHASFSPTNFALGDLATAGVTLLTLDMQSPFPTARSIDLDTRAGNASSVIGIHDYVYQVPDPAQPNGTIDQYGVVILNTTTGLTTRLLGFHSADTLTLQHHGGSITADALPLTGGNFVLDTSARATNTAESIDITTPSRPDGFLYVKDSFRDVLIGLTDYSTFRIQGGRAIDDLDLFVGAAASGANTVDIDAASVHGEFNVRLLGDATAVNHVTLRKAGLDADVSILGQNTTSDLLLGVGQLAWIRHNVFASNVQLAVDNDESELASILTLDGTTFGTWNIPTLIGVTPQLTFSNLRSQMTVYAGSGDDFQLDVTPANITGLLIRNEPPTPQGSVEQDLVYTSNWSVPLDMIGNFSFYAGRVLHRNGTVERIKKTAQVNAVINLDFSGSDPSEMILDADLDAPGAMYNITGDDFLNFNRVSNLTVGLYATAFGYSQADRFYIYATGATIDANLRYGPAAQFYFDGQARLGPAGIHPTEPNDITIQARYGAATMTPLAEFNSLLDMFNDVYILGAMPQDSLTVNMPTHVRMTSSVGEDLHLDLNPNAGAEFNGNASALVSWLEDIPTDGQSGSQQVFQNIRPANWDAYFAPGAGHGTAPNPFVLQPYGIDLPRITAEASVTYYDYRTINGVRTRFDEEYKGLVSYWLVDPNPVAVNNDVHLNASQLRGDLKWNVAAPDYEYVRKLEEETFFSAVTQSVSYSAPFHTWGTSRYIMRVAFGQSDITLSDVNPELEVGIDGGNMPFDYRSTANNNMHNVLTSPYPVTKLDVGDGDLTNLRGDVTAQRVQLEVNDRAATQPNIITLTATDVSWFDADNTRTTMGISQLRNGLTLTGGVVSQFAVESTPELFEDDVIERTSGGSSTLIVDVPEVVTIRNFAPAVAGFVSPGVYMMGHRTQQIMDVVGNLSLYVGRRLLTDGTVQNVGDLSGIVTFATDTFGNPIGSTNLNYTYTGSGRGDFVFDGSTFVAPGAGNAPAYPISIMATDDPHRAALRWNYANFSKELFFPSESINSVTFADNTDFTVYAPISGFFARSGGAYGMLIDNPTSAEIEYISNPQSAANRNDAVIVRASGGPLEVTGRGSTTRVVMQPLLDGVNPNGDLRSLVRGDVFVTNAAMQILPTNPLTPAGTPQPVVLTDTQLTGLTGGVVSFSNLASYSDVTSFNPITGLPALLIGMPHYGAASLTVNGTPSGVITDILTANNVPIGPTTVNATNGELWLGTITPLTSSNNDPRVEFRTSSLVIGDGDLDGIQGAIALSPGSNGNDISPGGVTIKSQTGPAAADVTFEEYQEANPRTNSIKLSGLSPAPIYWKTYLVTTIDVLGSANSHYTIARGTDNMRLFAGAGSTVDVFRTGQQQSTFLAGMSILGADTVTVNVPANFSASQTGPLRVLPDPARPAGITDLTINSSQRDDIVYLDSPQPGQGRFAGNSFTQANAKSYVVYDANHTDFTFLGQSRFPSTSDIRVVGTPALTTTIDPGNQPLHIAATSNPLEIHLTSGDKLTLGSPGQGTPGDTRPLLGNVTITVDAAAGNPAAIRFNSSADPTSRSISLNQVSADESTVTGMTAAPVHITGHEWTLALDGGAGNNTIIGPNLPSNWLIDAANAGKLNQTVSFTGMKNVVSGSQDDSILFKTNGSLAGNLDGGAGTDTLRYQDGMLTGSDVINLPNHVAPRVTGQALNLESSATFTALAMTNPGDQQNQTIAQITPVSISTTGGFGTKRFSATGLPDGLSINSQTGVVTGIPLTERQTIQTIVTVTDDSGSASATFIWRTLPGLYIVQLFNQTINVNASVSLQVQAPYTGTGTLTYSATGLPPGLSINSETGLISGAATDGSQSSQSYFSTISVTDGTFSAQTNVFWDVVKRAAITNPGTQVTPELIPVRLAIQVANVTGSVTYSATGLPFGVGIDSQTGVISGRFGRSFNGHANYNVTVTANTSQGVISTSFAWQTIPGFTPNGIFNRTSLTGAEVFEYVYPTDYLTSVITTTITGLPPGLSYDGTSQITGTIDQDAYIDSPYHPVVTFTNVTENYQYQATFDWTVIATIGLGSPGPKSFEIGDVVDVTIPVVHDFGNPLEFTADGLPLGLNINPQTGQITGTVQSFPFGQQYTNVTVTATETSGGTASGSVTFEWFVNSVPFILLSSTTIPENSPNGTVVGNLSLAEAGFTGDFYLLDDAEGRFSISPDGTQIIVADGSRLDFETNPTYRIIVAFAQGDDNGFRRAIDLTLTDVNEGAGAITLNPAAVPENSANGTVVGDLVPNDPPDGVTYTFSLTNDAGGRFALNGSQVVVADGAGLNYELNSSHVIMVRIEDSLGHVELQGFAIAVTNVNEGPVAFTLSPASISENSGNGVVVGDLIPSNVPEGFTFSFSLTNDAGGRFTVSGSQIIVINGEALDYEVNTSHVITVRIVDSDGNIQLQDFTIAVIDVPENVTVRYVKGQPPVSVLPQVALAGVGENLGGGTLQVSITDVAFGKKLKRFDVLSTSSLNGLGVVSAPQLVNGFLVVNVQLGASVTATQVKAALKGLKFSTAGKGLKTPTRTVKAQATDAGGNSSSVFTQTVQVLKKQPRE